MRPRPTYSSYEGECLAAVWAVVHFRPYLYGQSFTLVTDHQPLRWLMTNDKLTGKLARWALILQEYDFDVVHKAGTAHLDTDGISRNPAISSADNSGARQDGCTNQPDWESAGQVVVYLGLLSDGRPQTEDTSQAEAVFPQLGGDVWGDTQVMRYLQEGKLPERGSAGDRYRVLQRAGRFRWTDQQQLMRIGLNQDGEAVVPRPEEREAIISNAHERLGHFGTRRTHDLLRHTYWWAGMQADVAAYVARCKACDRVRSSFTARHPVLHPLPIQGLFYRWSLDIAGELPLTKRGGRYILIMIEHLSKWVEAVVLSEKSSGSTAAAFLDRVLSRFGGCAEVLTDRGSEFQGEFQALLEKALIDHRLTARDHPQADGLAERMVQTVKKGLRKYCLTHNRRDWDLYLPWLLMGYRCSRQEALSAYSPYYLLYGRHPFLPASIRQRAAKPVDLDSPETWAQVCSERGRLFEQAMPIAMDNLATAQHRDTLRYAQVRSGTFRARALKFAVGDYIYLQRQTRSTLDTGASRTILRIKQVLPMGVLLLEGADGRTIKDNVKNCAPCHLPDIDGQVDSRRAYVPADWACQKCGRADGEDRMLICDGCTQGWHLECLPKPLGSVPDGDWWCPRCTTPRQAAARHGRRDK